MSNKKSSKQPILFVCRSYVFAKNITDALKKAKGLTPHECWVDEKWKDAQANMKDAIGYEFETKDE